MPDCSSLPTVQDFEDSLKYMDSNKEFIESQQDTLVTPEGKPKYTITGAVNKLEQEALSRARTSKSQDFIPLNFFYAFAGFNASLSSYYVYSDDASIPTQLLLPDVHYEFADTVTETILLKDSYIGGKIIAKSLDPTGSGVISAGNSFESTLELSQSVGLNDNSICFVTGLTKSHYVISSTASFNVGDVQLNDGRVAVLQPRSNGYSVTAFGDSSSVPAHQSMFENAAVRALFEAKKATNLETFGSVCVPQRPDGGSWNLSAKTTTKALWNIEVGSEQQNPTNYPYSNMDNLSYLNGSVNKMNGRGQSQVIYGASDLQWVVDWNPPTIGTSVVTACSPDGKTAFLGCVRTGDAPTLVGGAICYSAYLLNDNIANSGVGYATYFEAQVVPGAGTTMCNESNVTPANVPIKVYPNQLIGDQASATFNFLIGGPVDSDKYPGSSSSPTSCAALISGGSSRNPANGDRWGFDAGFVFLHDAFMNSAEKEVLRMPTDAKQSYYSTQGALRCFTRGGVDGFGNGDYTVAVYGGSGAVGGFRFTELDLRPIQPDVVSLGSPSFKLLDGFFVNTPTGTSDENLKTEQTKINESMHAAALEVEPLLWKWKEAVKEKGRGARYHAGPMAQQVQRAFESHGIDPFKYGFIGYDYIEEEYTEELSVKREEDGEILKEKITKTRKTGEKIMNLRPIELLWVINSANKARQDKFEERLKALESKNV